MDNTSKTVVKAIDILEAFLGNDGTLNLTEVSRLTGLNTATTYRLATTLVKRGYLSHNRKKGIYSLGLKMLDYNLAIRKNFKFIDFAYLSLSKLCKAQGESVYLSVKDGDESVVIEEVGIDEELRMNSPVGKRLKLHCTAAGHPTLQDRCCLSGGKSGVPPTRPEDGKRVPAAAGVTRPLHPVPGNTGTAQESNDADQGIRCPASAFRGKASVGRWQGVGL